MSSRQLIDTLYLLQDTQEELLAALEEARLQLEYLDTRFSTSTTPAVLVHINSVLEKVRLRHV